MKKTYTTAIAFLISAVLYFPPVYGASCLDAKEITCGYPTSGSTHGGYSSFDKHDYGNYAHGIWYSGVDHMYKFKKTGHGPLNIHLATQKSGLNVFLASSCSGGKMNWMDSGKSMKGGMYIDNSHKNIPAGEYFIIVDSKDIYTKADYSLTITCGELDCNTATLLKCGETLWDQSNYNSYNNVSIYGCGYDKHINYTGNEKVFYFDLEYDDEVEIEVTGIKEGLDFDVFLFKGDHYGGCLSDGCIASSTLGLHNDEYISKYLYKGRYYVVVETWAHEHGYFNISLETKHCHHYSSNSYGSSGHSSGGHICDKYTELNCYSHYKNHTNSYDYSTNKMEKHHYGGKTYSGYNGYERSYEIHIEHAGEYHIDFHNHGYGDVNYDIFLYKNECGYGSAYAMSNRYSTHDEYISKWLEPGYYYLVVDTWYGEFGQYDIHISGCPTPSPNDLCGKAKYVDCGTTLSKESAKSGTNWKEDYYFGGQTYRGYDGHEMVYHFKLHKEEYVDIHLSNITGYGVNYDLFLYQTSCWKSNCIGMSRAYGHSDDKINIKLPAGDYYVIIDTWKGEYGSYDLKIGGCKSAGGGSYVDCGDAHYLSCGASYSGHTTGSSSSHNWNTYSCTTNGWKYDGPDNLYRIDKPAHGGKIQIHLETKEPGLNIILAQHCGDSFKCLKEGKDYYGGKYISQESNNWEPGEYYVIVDGKTSYTSGSYKIHVTCDSPNFSHAQEISCGAHMTDQTNKDGHNNMSSYACAGNDLKGYVGKEKIYSFHVPETKDMKIEVSAHKNLSKIGVMLFKKTAYGDYSCWASSKLVGARQVIEKTFVKGHYYAVVDASVDVTYDFQIEGCACAADKELSCDYPAQGNTWHNSNDFKEVSGDCFNTTVETPGRDMSFKFEAPSTGTYVFTLSDMTTNLDLYLVENCKDGKTCLGFATKPGMDDDVITADLEEGDIVYAIVDAFFKNADSEFSLSVECEAEFVDSDSDGRADSNDNCPNDANADQANNDGDDLGDACDGDDDNDGVLDELDCAPFDASIAVTIGDVCNDGNANTSNDRINENCECVGSDSEDRDNDGVVNASDNCPDDANDDQLDTDGDGEGDACDIDDDNDGVMDTFDCFPQDSTRSFKEGDVCDDGNDSTTNDRINENCECTGQGDNDGDGITDALDNCPGMPNADQADLDNDGIGNVCDNDRDGDGVANDEDCEPDDAQVSTKPGDACDDGNAETSNDIIREDCQCIGSGSDTDNDGIDDADDNCPLIANQDQIDFDGDGLGNSCDQDNDNDGEPDVSDCFPFDSTRVFSIGDACDDGNPNTSNDQINSDCECVGVGSASIYVSNAEGSVGDTVCVQVGVEGVRSIGSTMFTIRVNHSSARIVSVNNIGFAAGNFTASAPILSSVDGDTANVRIVSWTIEDSSMFNLMDSTDLVDVCIEIVSADDESIAVTIDDTININGSNVNIELNDADNIPIPLTISNGSISVTQMGGNLITGNISTVKGLAIPTVNVAVSDDDNLTSKTNQRGDYQLFVGDQESYVVKPYFDDRSDNGISMIDVLMLSRHLNFVTSFNNPYQYIAADLDGSGQLTIRDEQVLVRYMMGMLIEGEMPKSWRFIPDNYDMPTVSKFAREPEVLNHPESSIVNMTDLERFQNFTGVKMGDFDFSADYRGFAPTTVRSKGLDIIKSDQRVIKGQNVSITLDEKDFDSAEAFLLNFSVDKNALELVEAISEMDKVSITTVDEIQDYGNLAFSAYANQRDYNIAITFKAKRDGLLSEMISIRNDAPSRIISSELEERKINLHFEKVLSQHRLFISPNPVETVARLIYDTEHSGDVDITITSADGRILYTQERFAERGSNVFMISQNELKTSDGIIFISIQNHESRLIERAVMMH